jgi:proteasome lid subunit RPN8/RPN11
VAGFEAGELSFAELPERNPDQVAGRAIKRGNLSHGDLKIYIPSQVLEEMSRHADEDIGMELGGVLVGDSYSWKGYPYVVVSGYVPAQVYQNTPASFRFTPDTWTQIHADIESLYPGKQIVGWHHTHPGYGVFLSGADRFIQNNFLNLPNHFAAVTDPRSRTFGFFQNKDGQVDKLDGYFETL